MENNDGWGPYLDVITTFQFWIELNSCTQTVIDTLPDIDPSDGSFVISERHTDGINNNEVWLYKLVNGGHDWPGIWGNMDFNATEEIWSFFSMFIDNAVGVDGEGNGQPPSVFELYQNYPNPFNPVTTLIYYLPEQSLVNITVYDMLGREIKKLINTTQETGRWSTIWDATNNQGNLVSDGVNLYEIKPDKFAGTKKMVFFK